MMDAAPDLKTSLRRARLWIVCLFLIVPVSLLLAVWLQPWVPPSHATRDPLTVAAILNSEGAECCSRYLGAISTMGLVLWSAGSAVGLTGAMLASILGAPTSRIVLLGLLGALTAWLLLDDAFMLHEGYGTKIFGAVDLLQLIPVVATVPLLANIVIARSFDNFGLLLAALVLLAGSLNVDNLLPQVDMVIFYEDALKFLGISLWTAYIALKTMEITLASANDRRQRRAI